MKNIYCLMATAIILSGYVHATPPTMSGFGLSLSANQTNGVQVSDSFLTELSRSSTLLGDMGGLREFLSKYGMTLSIQETSEYLGNVSGGVREGFDYDGLTQVALQMDTQRAFGWHGGTFNVSALQIHGNNLSANNLYTLQTASGIEADRATRLWELWYQQKFLSDDRADVKVGQQSLDQEFMVSQNALLFVNTMFGWPMLPSADLPGGGPAYPLSALGVRLRVRPTDSLTALVGVFNGSPVYNNNGDPQMQNRYGLSFPLNGGALVIGELQYTYPAIGSMTYSGTQPLAGTYKLGFWYNTENFDDLQYDNTGLSLANPNSTGIPQSHYGNYSLYGVIDQMIWTDPSDEDADQTVNFFARIFGAPQQDRNLISFSANAGFTFHEPIPHRGDDTFGIGMGYAKLSDSVSGLDRNIGSYSSAYYPVQSSETFVEITYQYQLTPWCQIQPDFQYVFNPSGGILNPNSPGQTIKNEAVLGVRVNVLF
jgi:porin